MWPVGRVLGAEPSPRVCTEEPVCGQHDLGPGVLCARLGQALAGEGVCSHRASASLPDAHRRVWSREKQLV